MAGIGGFGPEMRAPAVELIYWHLTGGFRPGEIKALMDKKNDELTNAVENAIRGLEKLIDHYDEPDRCYLARPYPALTPRFSDYTQLARVAEWSAAAVSDDEGAAV